MNLFKWRFVRHVICCVILWYTSSANASDSLINIFKILWKYMDQYHESQTAGKCIATSSPAKHDMSQARLYRINDYDVEQNYEKSCLASVPQQYLIHKQHKHLDISDQPKSYMSSWKSSKEGDLPLCIFQKREILRETTPRHKHCPSTFKFRLKFWKWWDIPFL